MGELLDAIQVGAQIAAQRNHRRAQQEATRQRQAEALALQQWRQEQIFNQARDDERAQKQAEDLAAWHIAENQRRAQEGIDRTADRKTATDDRSAAANQKLAEQMAIQKYQDAFQEGMTTRNLSGIDLQDESIPLDQFGKPRTTMEAFDYAARKPGVKVPADMLEKRMTAEMTAERIAMPRNYAPSDIQKMINEGLLTKDQGPAAALVRTGQQPRAAADKPDISEADWISKHLQEFMKDPMKVPSKEPPRYGTGWMNIKPKQVPMTRDEAIVELRKQYRALYGGAGDAAPASPGDRAYNPKSRKLE